MRTLLIGGWVGLCLAVPAARAEKVELFAGGDRAKLQQPFGMAFAPDGALLVVEFGGHSVQKVAADGTLTTLAGGKKGGADGAGAAAAFNAPHNLCVAPDGTVYVADTMNHTVRKLDPKTRAVTTIAGTGEKGFAGDGGPATAAKFDQTYHVCLDPAAANLYVCDIGNRRVRKIDLKTNVITTVVGNGKRAAPADGTPAADAPLVDPRAAEIDKKGRLYILERGGNALRVVEDGKVRTVVGGGEKGASGDGGPGPKATLNGPKCLWIDPAGDVLIADTENHVVRKYVVKDGTIQRVAGTGKRGSGGLGKAPAEVELAQPHGVAVGPDGTLYIADSSNNRILKVVK